MGPTTLFAWAKNKVNKNEKLWFNIDDNLKLLNNSLFKTNKINFKKPIAIIISSRTASAGEFCGVIFKGRENCKFLEKIVRGYYQLILHLK